MKTEIDIYADNPAVTLDYKIAVMQAYRDGQPLQIQPVGYNAWVDLLHIPQFDWQSSIFRIRPAAKPKVKRPLNEAELLKFLYARHRLVMTPSIRVIAAWQPDSVFIAMIGEVAAPALMKGWELSTDRVNWVPAYVES